MVFQEKLSSSSDLGQDILLELRNEALPRFAPLDFREKPGFNALKIFGLAHEFVAVSFVSDSHQNDSWNRPLLRADVAIFDHNSFNTRGRDVFAVEQFLATSRSENLGPSEIAASFAGTKNESLVTSSPTALDDLLRNIRNTYSEDRPFLAKLFSTLLRNEKIIISGFDVTRDPIKLFFLSVPFDRLTSMSLTTTCTEPLNHQAENVILTQHFDQGMLPRLDPRGPSVIDLSSRSTRKTVHSTFGELVLDGVLQEGWYSFDRMDQYRLTLDCLESLAKGTVIDFTKSNQKFTAMRKTLQQTSEWVQRLSKVDYKVREVAVEE